MKEIADVMEGESSSYYDVKGQTEKREKFGTIPRPYDRFIYSLILFSLICLSIYYFAFPESPHFPLIALCFSVLLFGSSELGGACGTSHVSVLGMLYRRGQEERSERQVWLKAASLYTVGGLISASLLGAATGAIGKLVSVGSSWATILILILALVCFLREIGFFKFKLPQIELQTNPGWSSEFGILTAAMMWGVHIGLAYFTVIAHTGFYLIVALCLLLGPQIGALLFSIYWVGRALPLWITPYAVKYLDDEDAVALLVHHSHAAYTKATVVGIMMCGISTFLIFY